MRIWNAWCSLSLQAMGVALDTQAVIALRCMRIARESVHGHRSETQRMVAEKIAALTEAQIAALTGTMSGGGHRGAKKLWAFTKGVFAATGRDLRTTCKPSATLACSQRDVQSKNQNPPRRRFEGRNMLDSEGFGRRLRCPCQCRICQQRRGCHNGHNDG
jgi:hypothetical protein